MDPQDLLYTNQFISEKVLSTSEIEDSNKYYYRFQNDFVKNNISETDYYINQDTEESDPINLNKTLNQPFPVNQNKNHYPLFDKYMQDIVSNRYVKEVITKVNIDSYNRDKGLYQSSSLFSIEFPRVFNNVTKVIMDDIIFPNVSESFSNYINNIAWQYASANYLLVYNIDTQIIPVPDPLRLISYSKLPYSVYINEGAKSLSYIENSLVYQTNISPGFYSVADLTQGIELSSQNVPHGYTYLQTTDIMEEPYNSFPDLQGTPTLMNVSINPTDNIVNFVNRMEEIEISTIQTFSTTENNFSLNDIFYNFTNQTNYYMNPNFVYITLPYRYGTTSQYYPNPGNPFSPSAFPLVINNLLVSIGNLNYKLFNYVEFFDINIYLQNGLYTESELIKINTYQLWDTITIGTYVFLRFALRVNYSNNVLTPFDRGNENYRIRPRITQNIVFSSVVYSLLEEIKLYNFIYKNDLVTPLIGRALLFRFIFDIDSNGNFVNYEVNTYNKKKRSLLKNLAWPVPNQTDGNVLITEQAGFFFVQKNIQGFLVNAISQDVSKYQNIQNNFPYPFRKLPLQRVNGTFYFITQNYVYIKISVNNVSSFNEQQNYMVALSNTEQQYEQNYINSYYMNVGIGEDYNCVSQEDNIYTVYNKSQDAIFAKVLLSNVPGNIDAVVSNINTDNCFTLFYNKPLDNLNNITVSVYDQELQILPIGEDYSFTLKIYENQEILKETYVDTKRNNVFLSGKMK